MTIFYFMSVATIISGFSFQIPTTPKSLNLVYVLSKPDFYLLWLNDLGHGPINLFKWMKSGIH